MAGRTVSGLSPARSIGKILDSPEIQILIVRSCNYLS